MKIHRFPSSASRLNKVTSIRAALVMALIAACSYLPYFAFAQNETAPVKGYRNYTLAEGGAFIIYQGENGDTVCRDATLNESRALRAGDYPLQQINHLDDKPSLNPNATNAMRIVLRATAQLDANPEAKAAFIAAAAKWEALIQDPITIIIDVDYGTSFFGQPFSGSNVVGATATQAFLVDYPEVRGRLVNRASTPSEAALYAALPPSSVPTNIGSVNTTVVAGPLLRALGALNANANDDPTSRIQPRIGFNSAFGFDFNPSDGITGNRTDFDAVAVHEMGHALGFNSETGARELDSTRPLAMTVWDLFRFRPGTANLNNFNTAQRILTSGATPTDPHVHFAGGPELGLSTGRPDGNGGDDEQPSHWKDDRFTGVFVGIMDPTIARNVREVMVANDQNAIDIFGYTITPTSAPPNDNFVNAQVISGNSGSVSGTNAFATQEAGEPNHSEDPVVGGKSIWYRWIAPNSGTVTMTTVGSNFDTLLAVYTGSAVNGLALVVKNDDENNPGGVLTSRVQFSALSGTTYQIAVDGYGGDQGSTTLNWNLPGGATPTPTPTPGPNTVQFTTTTASATEAPNTTVQVDLNVTRTGNTAAAATVNFATSDATASERSDYEAAIGSLRFAAGETSRTITVFIVDDAYGESPETFNVTLSNCVSCTLGSPIANTVTINSNEAVNGANPVQDPTFNTDFFVRQQYLDFFNRAPDAGGLAFWKNQIDECLTQECREIRRINVSAAFFLSIEFQETGYLVYKTWGAAFGTTRVGSTVPLTLIEFLPDQRRVGDGVVIGQVGADALLEANKVAYFNEFVARPAFLSAYPNFMTPAQFVDALNANAGGALSTAERNQLVTDLTNATKTRAQVLRAVVQDLDFHAAQLNRAFVLMQYFGYLRRNPNDSPNSDFSGYNFWIGKLNQFDGNFVNAEMVKAFITSTEYQARFGPTQ